MTLQHAYYPNTRMEEGVSSDEPSLVYKGGRCQRGVRFQKTNTFTNHRTPAYGPGPEQLFIVNDVETEKKKMAMLMEVIGPKAYGLLKDFLSLKLPVGFNYSEHTEKMKLPFTREPPLMAENDTLYARKTELREHMKITYQH